MEIQNETSLRHPANAKPKTIIFIHASALYFFLRISQ